VVVVAVPGDAVEDAIGKVDGVQGKVVVDATNPLTGRPEGFDSLAQQVKSLTNGPVAKAFNSNFSRLYEELPSTQNRPSCFYCGDDEARETTEQLIRDAGYEPVYSGGLENARALEDYLVGVMLPAVMSGRGQFFYRVAGPGEL
jgi:predicted dinucleotide-binding enzyme